ncbi:hypothetical protein E4U43_003615 [Claviceps pusilla]|uniref:Uncharacterized protein n=1 Tax=Claviceps pusilla TaxID=123648 RepID=A0A9P7N598_9HYPO|nr:hypothetical protein E4U43_003615 [Claviceps pusilla]
MSSRARLRHTFRYPDDTSVPETLDEQEQESLISDLSAQNALQNHRFTRLLLVLPLATTMPYLPLLVRHPQPHDAILALLSLTSLLSTTYLLYTLPPESTGLHPLDAWSTGRHGQPAAEPAAAAAREEMKRQARRLRRGLGYDRAPLEMYLPYLNGVLVVLLALMGLVTERTSADGGFGWIGKGNLPGIIYGVVLVAKVVMGGVDPERDLSPLKYEYRGA